MPFEAKRFRHRAVAIPEVRVSPGIAVSPRQQSPEPQQADFADNQSVVGWRVRQPGDRGLGFDPVTIRPAIQQCLHQNTRRGNAPHQQPSLAKQMVDGGAHEWYGLIAIYMPSPFTRHVHIDNR